MVKTQPNPTLIVFIIFKQLYFVQYRNNLTLSDQTTYVHLMVSNSNLTAENWTRCGQNPTQPNSNQFHNFQTVILYSIETI